MTTGVLIFEGMKVGVLPGDFTVQVDENGSVNANLVLSTAYNVLPIWIRAANDHLLEARKASEAVRNAWSADDQANRELLIAELEPCMQVFVACGIALDALYDQLRPFAKLSAADLKSWKDNKTARETQISEVVRRVFRLDAEMAAKFKQNLAGIFEYRDKAVHPSFELRQTSLALTFPSGSTGGSPRTAAPMLSVASRPRWRCLFTYTNGRAMLRRWSERWSAFSLLWRS